MTGGYDNLDFAADLTRKVTDAGVAAVRELAKPEQLQNADGTWPVVDCAVCGDELGPRAALAKIRCLGCQEALERRSVPWRR